jgi:hypothetical protein
MNLEVWINIKLFVASWCHNLVMRFSSLGSFGALGTWVLMTSLKKIFAYPKYPLKEVQKPINHV